MIDVVTPELRPMYADQLEQMFRQRYEIFVEQLGWDLPSKGCAERLEKDQFESADAIYMLVSSDGITVEGSVRMLPTKKPHMMSEVFRHLCPKGVPQGEYVWEVSRMYVCAPQRSREERRVLARAQAIGLIEFGLLYGLEQITFQTSTDKMHLLDKNGYDYAVLGDPDPQPDGTENVACTMFVSVASLHKMRAIHQIDGPVIHMPRRLLAA